ncbi:MAG: polysaccharide biosynthesis protein [Chloroflexi bacterium]|nr:polysaccharide biosynthesis protein [Chloroflexota bacterium]
MKGFFRGLFYAIRIKRFAAWATIDALIILFAYLIAFSVRAVTTPLSPFIDSFPFIALSGCIIISSLYIARVYPRVWSKTGVHGLTNLMGGVIIATAVILFIDIIAFRHDRPLPLSVVMVANALAFVGFTAIRYRSRLVTGVRWRWNAIWNQEFPIKASERVLLVGAGESGQILAIRFRNREVNSHDYKVVGFVDDDPAKQGFMIEGYRVLGACEDIPTIVQNYQIDLVVITIHNISSRDLHRILTLCEKTDAVIKLAPDVLASISKKTHTPLLRDMEVEDFIGRKPIGKNEAVDLSAVSKKVILITGAAGSIGSELSRQILDYEPACVILLDNNESGLHDLVIELKTRSGDLKLIDILADITHRSSLECLFGQYKPQVVFHAAAYKHVPLLEKYPDEGVRVNIGGTHNLAGLAQEHHVERFVLISTDKAVNPASVMGATKRICELLMYGFSKRHENRTLFTSVRFGNVLGSRGSVVPTFNKQIDNGGPVTVTHPEMTRYFMAIPEAVNLVIHAACLTQGNDLFMLHMGEVVKIVELAERMIRMRGLRPHKDIVIEFSGIRPGEKLHEELHAGGEATEGTIHPNIEKVMGEEVNFDCNLFFERVLLLLEQGLLPKANPLSQLQGVVSSTDLMDNAAD